MASPRIGKRQRVSRACDFCHNRGLKCRWRPVSCSSDSSGCLTCIDYGADCAMTRPVRKRGKKTVAHQRGRGEEDDTSNFRSMPTILRLLQIYQNTMYQCYFPFVPENDLMSRWKDGLPDPEQPSYMLLMALCAVSSQTAALDGVFDRTLVDGHLLPDSGLYYQEAVSRIPLRIAQPQDLDYLRSFGLLAVYSLHSNDYSDLHRNLGLYHALAAQHTFHDETRWPANIPLSEVDERRRLYWCVYRLEIHSACILGHMMRMPEAQISVHYPRITPAMHPEAQAWTAGWDYITDLFRLLEYAIFSLRGCRDRKATLAVFCARPSPTTLLDGLTLIKASKPRILLGLSDFDTDRCNYMAVQITCSETIVSIMTLLYCRAPVSEVMRIAEKLLNEVTQAPLIIFKVAGSQIVHQLLGVGHMLHNASRYDGGEYAAEAKRLIAFFGDLVQILGHDIPFAATAAERLLTLAGSA